MVILNDNIKQEYNLLECEKQYRMILGRPEQNMIKVTVQEEKQQIQWSKQFSLEDLQQGHRIFKKYKTIYNSFNFLTDFIQKNEITIDILDKNLYLIFSGYVKKNTIKVDLNFQLEEEAYYNNEEMINPKKQVIIELNQENQVQKKQDECLKQINGRHVGFNDDEAIFFCFMIFFVLFIVFIMFLIQNNENINKKISGLKIQSLFREFNSDILSNQDFKTIEKWIYKGENQMKLKLLYKSSLHGFEINEFFKRTANLSPTLFVIKTRDDLRFGGYTDLLWKQGSGCIEQIPNKTFVFSLEMQKKFSQDESCAIFSKPSSFGFNSFEIFENSFYNKQSNISIEYYNDNKVKENIAYFRDEYYFQTKEIEVYQVLQR